MKHLEVVPFVTVPCGWMPCVACSDFKKTPGLMWVGYTYTRADEFIVCPVCNGTGQVEKLKNIDIRTGKEIDYEAPNQKFIPTGQMTRSVEAQSRDKIIIT